MLGCPLYILVQKNEKKQKAKPRQQKTESEIFSIAPALKFGALFILVSIVTQVSLLLFGQTGFLVSSALAGFTGIDAATLNISELTGKTISLELATFAFILVNAVNLSAKVFYSFIQGARVFAFKLGIGMVVIAAASLLGLLAV